MVGLEGYLGQSEVENGNFSYVSGGSPKVLSREMTGWPARALEISQNGECGMAAIAHFTVRF